MEEVEESDADSDNLAESEQENFEDDDDDDYADKDECDHPGRFLRITEGAPRRGFRCERCNGRVPRYILQCRRCSLRVCERCRRRRV